VPGAAWLKLGITPFTTETHLPSAPGGAHSLEIRVELEGYQPVDTQITSVHWSGEKGKRSAKITVPLKPLGKDPRTGKQVVVTLKPQPDEPPRSPAGEKSEGPVTVETTPPGATVWLFLGGTPARFSNLIAGRPYELRVLAKDYLPAFVAVTAEDWRDPTDDPSKTIDRAKKKPVIEKSVELRPDPKGK
jgi:hypothetical protein